ncbi:MAG: TonB-dependent receptor [Bacteroidota bacterium]
MFKLLNKILFLVLIAGFQSLSAQIEITGTVTDENGEALIGATIVEKGTVSGTVTDLDGKYVIEVSDGNSVLVFSYISYLSKEIAVGGNRVLDMILELDRTELDEVVVVGYGVQKKSDVTGAIVSVKSAEISKTISVNAASALQGKAAGVAVTSNSGTPGGGLKVRIRGVGTIGDASPLYVVDGFPTNDIGYLNPGDIESMEVLKDASASAIYGARGANGVILITTKSGGDGDGIINFSAYYGSQSIRNTPNIMTGPEYYETMKEMYANAGGQPFQLKEITPEGLPYAGDTTHTTDWFDQLSRVAPVANYELSVSGGNDKSHYMLGGSIMDQEGTIIGSSYNRQTLRFKVDTKVKDWLEVGFNSNISNKTRTSVTERSMYYGIVLNTLRTDPLTPILHDSTQQYYEPAYQDIGNPVANVAYDNYVNKQFRTVNNVYASISFLDHFILRSSFGLDLNYSTSDDYYPERYYLGSDKNDRPYSTIYQYNGQTQSWLNENIITYSRDIEDHSFTVMAGFTAQEITARWLTAEKDTLAKDIEVLRYFNSATGEERVTGSASANAMISYLGRVNYNYKDKYLLTSSVRADGSSRFGANNRFGVFPSVSAGWNILREPFMQSAPALSRLKLRAGWGQIGNDKISNYGYSASVNFSKSHSYILGGPNSSQHQVYGAAPSNFGNPNLKWETVESTNFGIDFGLFENRISGSLEYYIKNTKEMLVREPVPQYVGFTSNPYSNIGEMRNQGFELSMTYKEVMSDFSYDVTLNGAINRNELVTLGKGQPIPAGTIQAGSICLNDVGHPIGSFYGYVTDGIFQNQEEIDGTAQPDARPGDIRYLDLNGDGTITDYDRTFIGNPQPKLFYGINFNAQYKGFDLYLFFQGSYGNQVFNATNWYLWHTAEQYNRSKDLLESWDGEGSTDKFPALNTTDLHGNNNRISDRYIEDGSYLRLKNLQIGYTLPGSLTGSVGMKEVRIYVSGQNLLTFTKYSGLDPEIGNLYSDLSAGVDLGTYPQYRIIQMGAKIVF